MIYYDALVILSLLNFAVVSLSSYRIDLEDGKVFEITSDDIDYNEENENEMIQPGDLAGLNSIEEEESRYKPLHSYVQLYNIAESRDQFSKAFNYFQPNLWESKELQIKEEPFVAGFKEELDKGTNDKSLRSYRMKREDEEYPYQTTSGRDADFFQMRKPINLSLWEGDEDTDDVPEDLKASETTMLQNTIEYEEASLGLDSKETVPFSGNIINEYNDETEPSDEEAYDYKQFKMEYEEQILKDINTNKSLNYTEKKEEEESPKVALKVLLDVKSKNCTDATKLLGVKTLDCLIYNLKYEKEKPIVKKTLSKLWLYVRIWLLIYVCLAIPCWCQRGWCCCCFCCKSCYPRKRILLAKKYYALNPPGILANRSKKKTQQIHNYEPTEFEQDAYESFEAAIRNI